MKKCENCKHGEDYGESVKWIKCERKKKAKYVEKEYVCKHYELEKEFGSNLAVMWQF